MNRAQIKNYSGSLLIILAGEPASKEEPTDVLPTPRHGDPYAVEFPWEAEMKDDLQYGS